MINGYIMLEYLPGSGYTSLFGSQYLCRVSALGQDVTADWQVD